MNEIEAKRVCPECDDALMDLDKKRCERCQETWNDGYKMARKEILVTIERLPKCYCNAGEECRHLKQIKQSLEEKK